jgi:DNA-directed RNA polymerase specialized sigma24 family protein
MTYADLDEAVWDMKSRLTPEDIEHYDRLLGSFNKEYATYLRMHYIDGLKPEEIARKLEMDRPPDHIESMVDAALWTFREHVRNSLS